MPEYIADKIISGEQSYEKVFSTALYKKYQDDVDRILTEKGRVDLIKR